MDNYPNKDISSTALNYRFHRHRLLHPCHILHYQQNLIPEGVALNRVLEQFAVFLIPANLNREGRRVFNQIRIIALHIEELHYLVSLACCRDPESVLCLLVERLKLPEKLRVIEKILKVVSAPKLEDIDSRTLFCYIKEGHRSRSAVANFRNSLFNHFFWRIWVLISLIKIYPASTSAFLFNKIS